MRIISNIEVIRVGDSELIENSLDTARVKATSLMFLKDAMKRSS